MINRLKGSNEVNDLEDIRFIDIDAATIASQHPDALYELYHSKKHGFLIRNFLSPEELSKLQQYALQNHGLQVAKTDVGYTFPMIFQEFSLRNQALEGAALEAASKQYFESNEDFNHNFFQTTGVDLYGKINLLFQSLGGGRKVEVPQGVNGYGRYLFGNFRHLHPKGGLMSVHCGNFFGTKFELIYRHLCERIKVVNQMSYFVMIQKPDEGGQLSVFNLRWVPGQTKSQLSEDEVVLLSNGAKLKIDEDSRVKRLDLLPEPGDMILFQGGNIWHRVAKVFGTKERITFGGFMGIQKDESTFFYWT
ncbi:MAG: hypothetical protein U0T84_02340 [Chitinophagales bacterium]